jgi:hypothetical protein
MYAFDLATRWNAGEKLIKALFSEGLNPEWICRMDVLKGKNPFVLKDWMIQQGMGCFKVRETKNNYIIYSDICRLPKKKGA